MLELLQVLLGKLVVELALQRSDKAHPRQEAHLPRADAIQCGAVTHHLGEMASQIEKDDQILSFARFLDAQQLGALARAHCPHQQDARVSKRHAQQLGDALRGAERPVSPPAGLRGPLRIKALVQLSPELAT